MGKEAKNSAPVELIVQRQGKTVFARLREDREFSPAEVAGAAAFSARFASLERAKRELHDLMAAGGFRIVVPASSALAPEQTQVVVFGDMSGAAGSKAPAERPAPPRPRVRRATAAPKPTPAPAKSTPVTPVPAPALASAPAPASGAPAAPPVRKRRKRATAQDEEKAFQDFYRQWRARNRIARLPQHELDELRQGEWQEVKERFMADWRKLREQGA